MGSCLSSENQSIKHERSDVLDSIATGPPLVASTALVSDPSDQGPAVIVPDKLPTPILVGKSSSVLAAASPTKADDNHGKQAEPSSDRKACPSLAPRLPSECSTPSNAELPEHIAAGRPKTAFAPQDSRMSVYSDIAEIQPVVDHALPTIPPNAQIPSTSVTPQGNALMLLNRAMILKNRLEPGALQKQLPQPRPAHAAPEAAAPKSSALVGGAPASKAADAAGSSLAAGKDLPSLAASGNAASCGGDDSVAFDVSAGNSASNTAGGTVAGAGDGGGGASISQVTMTTGMSASSAQQGLDSSTGGGISLSGISGALGGASSSALSAFASAPSLSNSSVFGSPLHGLGVEATLGEMQQMALIGSGGGGCVYIGRWRGVTVAVKFIVSSNDDQLTRSQREALLSRLASHPHVVQTYATSVTQLTEQMFKSKDGGPSDAFPGGMAAADPNISHDVLAGLTSGSWIRGELQMALNGNVSGQGGVPPMAGAPLPTIMETARSSAGSASASVRGITGQGGASSVNHTTTYESDGQLSSSSVTRPRGQPEAGIPAAQQGQNETTPGVTGSAGHSCQTSTASSCAGANARLLQTALNGGAPPSSGPLSSDNHAPDGAGDSSRHATNSGGGSGGGDIRPGAAGAAGAGAGAPGSAAAGAGTQGSAGRAAGGQQSQGVADSFDASFVRDHLGRAKYSIHEVLRQLGAHEGQFLTMVIMEYCDGGSLLAALKEGPFHRDTTSWSPRMLLRSTVRTALEIAHGMQHLHLSGLVHGDLKPGNVLLKGSNQDKRRFVAKVSDLGIAHPLGSADEMTIDDGQIGSIAYMAPEVFRGRIMKASDVYSFGVLLWQLVSGTGAAPFEGAHPIAIALGVSEGKMTLRWPQGVFRPLQQLGELCTQTDPAARPSFKSVVGALEKLERHMQRLAAAAAVGGSGGGGGGGGNVSLTSPASSLSTPVGPMPPAPASGVVAGSPSTTGALDKPSR